MRTIGIDVGTSAVKAVLAEIDGGVSVTEAVSESYSPDGAPTRDPERWVTLARRALAALITRGRPDAVGLTGQMHGLIAVDRDGRLAAPVKLWLDMDGAPDLDKFVTAHGGAATIVEKSGNLPLPDFTLAKWLYALGRDPTLADRVHRLYCVKDFVRRALDPAADFVVDANEACGMQLQDPLTGTWSDQLTAAARLPRSALPEIVEASSRAGDCGGFRADLKGVPFVLGVGDQAAAMRAVGVDRPGTLSLSLGTSGVLSFAIAKDHVPSGWDGAFHLFPTGYSPMLEVIGTVPGFGATLHWLARLLGRTIEEIDVLAEATRPGDPAPVFLPYLAGAGAPNPFHDLSAELLDFRDDLTPERLVRAVYDGLAQEIGAILEDARALGIGTDRVILSGNPIRLARLLATLVAYLEAECSVVDVASASAVGAALIAADHLDPGLAPRLEAKPLGGPKLAANPAWLAARHRALAAARGRAD